MKTVAAILLRALPAGLAALALHGIFGLVHWYTWGAYAVIGLSMSLFARGTDILVWQVITGKSAIKIGGSNAGATRRIVSTLPFWFFAGGCGYATGMLLSKKLLLLGFYDIPVRPIFLLGGITGCILEMIYASVKMSKFSGDAYDTR